MPCCEWGFDDALNLVLALWCAWALAGSPAIVCRCGFQIWQDLEDVLLEGLYWLVCKLVTILFAHQPGVRLEHDLNDCRGGHLQLGCGQFVISLMPSLSKDHRQ